MFSLFLLVFIHFLQIINMSLPWLSDGFKPTSKSGSKSPDTEKVRPARMDQFGRTLPSRSRSRSRSPDNDRDRRNELDRGGRQISLDRDNYRRGGGPSNREKGWKEDRGRPRSRRRGSRSSSSSSSDHSTEKIRLVAREEPKYLNARVFVASIVSKSVTKEELTKHFEKYGNVVGKTNNYWIIVYLDFTHPKGIISTKF